MSSNDSNKKVYNKEYFRQKMRESRERNNKRKHAYIVEIEGKKYVFLKKQDIKIEKVDFTSIKSNDNLIKCF